MRALSLPPGDWTPLPVHASTRSYFHGTWKGRPALLAHFEEDRDSRQRFVLLSRWLRDSGIQVPEVWAFPEGMPWLVQEFVEGKPLSHVRWDEALEERVLERAATFARLDPEEWPAELVLHTLDAPRLRFEMAFFDLHFLQGLLNWPADEARGAALSAWAEEVATFPSRLLHRDFHSDNILLDREGALVVLDFQDLLLGPRCYDIASLYMDAYRTVPPGFRHGCVRKCAEEWGAGEEELTQTALQRGLKALGTFGYQVTRLKRPRYLTAARETLPKVVRLLKGSSLEPLITPSALQEAAAWL